MLKYLLVFCVLLSIGLCEDIQNQTDIFQNDVKVDDKKISDKTIPNDIKPFEGESEREEPPKGEIPPEVPPRENPPHDSDNDKGFCDTMSREGIQRCKIQYKEITKGELSSRKICCAIKTLQQCVVPVLNQFCTFEAFNDIEKELHGINQICKIIGQRYCPKNENQRRRS